MHNESKLANRRIGTRKPFEGPISIRFEEQEIVGPGQNLSEDGVFFVADGSVKVRVSVGDGSWHVGEVVRVQSMGEGKLGIAVRFTEGSDT